ncbi:hypothetical protein RN607_00515 [Demequina capsici]|uniref:Uncharacterized protein n=1 Tax=Demequina capsici TaxID=3075620 RepID=A0AA96FFJ6_9MICO|nr:hypothetical protein [Demequina sp. PMTSA13]WNM27515.1 hypothetical protein RN607_00515 [Demequina sp. PMTSA13]
MPKYGGELRIGETSFWLGHLAYLDMVIVLKKGTVFMYRGESVDGPILDRWAAAGGELGEFFPDPALPDRISFTRESTIVDDIDHVFRGDAFPLIFEDDTSGGLLITELPEPA